MHQDPANLSLKLSTTFSPPKTFHLLLQTKYCASTSSFTFFLVKKKKMTEKLQQQIRRLSNELDESRESERKMLDSLVRQTKQLEQTKISLEEAKLEIKHLNDTTKLMGEPKEMQKMRAELKKALEAEAKSKKAMDELAVVLKEVSSECNRAKKSYYQAQNELDKLHAEAGRLRAEVDDSSNTWRAKEAGFLNCIKMSEEEIAYMKNENDRLHDSKKAAREEISNLRDIVKQAIRETTAVKEALEITRNENSQLKKVLMERERAINQMKHDYESLKVTEAAAVCSVKELSGLLAATVSLDASECSQSFDEAGECMEEERGRGLAKFPSENWAKEWNTVKLSMFDEKSGGESSNGSSRDGYVEMGTGTPPLRLKKKRPSKQGLRKFGNMLKMASYQRPWTSDCTYGGCK